MEQIINYRDIPTDKRIDILISIPPPSAGGTNSNESISTLYVVL